MRVAVKNMSGVFIHSTTPRKARLLLKEKKAVIESNNPFTIRLLFSESECGLKDSKPLNKFNSGLLPEKDITMCGNEEINVLAKTLNEFYVFTLQSIRHILNSTDVDKVTWYTKNSAYASGENDPESFADMLHSTGRMLFSKNHRVMGNFVLIGKQGFDILKRVRSPRVSFKGDTCVIDSFMNVKYIPSMDDNRFIVSVYESIKFDDNNDYKEYYSIYENMDAIVVGDIVDGEKPNESIEVKSEMDDKCDTVSTNSIKMDSKTHLKRNSKTHLIYGAYGCGKTSMVMDIINERIENDNNTMLLTTSCTKRLFYKNTKSPMIRIVDGTCINVTADNNTPELFAKYLVQYYISREGRMYADTLIVDDYPFSTINADYSEEEYFRELTKACKENKINLIYTKGTASKEGVYSSLPPIFERFSDIITVLK